MKKTMFKCWLATGILALCSAQIFVSCDKKDNEVTKEVTKPVMDISKFQIAALGGANVVGIAPTEDWKMESKSSWLTISPAAGTKDVKEIVLTSEPNTGFENRSAVIDVTVGDVTQPMTVVQEGTQREIRIYGDTIFFNKEQQQVKVSPITANIEVVVDETSIPAWIEAVELTKHPDGYYEALVLMNPNRYDDELRSDSLIFKDKDSDYQVAFPIVCEKFEMTGKYTVDVPEIPDFSGKKEFAMTVYRGGDTEQDSIVAWQLGDGGRFQKIPDVRISLAEISAKAAIYATGYHVNIAGYQDDWGSQTRSIYFYVLPKSEAAAFNPSHPAGGKEVKPDLTLIQKNTDPIFTAIRLEQGSYSLKVGEPRELRVTVDGNIIPGLEVLAIYRPDFFGEDSPLGKNSEAFPLTVKYVKMEADGDFITYVYNITATEASVKTKGNLILCVMGKDPITGKYIRDSSNQIWRAQTPEITEILLGAEN